MVQTTPLVIIIDENDAGKIETIDAGAAYTEHLHKVVGAFPKEPLSNYVDIIANSVNPQGNQQSTKMFEYVDLREVDDIYGQILKVRRLEGREIGSTKNRFQKWDILFAKIMPSLENKKIALVTQDVQDAIASTEFIILRKKPDANINLYYLFRALRADEFTQQAIANVSGATGRQRINPRRLLELHITVPPPELQAQIGDAVEQEFSFRTLANEQAISANDEAEQVVGVTTLRVTKPSSRIASRISQSPDDCR